MLGYFPTYMGVSGYSGMVSYILFLLVLTLLFRGFLPYRYCAFCNLRFTVWFCFTMWLAATLHFYSCVKFSVHFTAPNRMFLNRLFFGLIELVRELSRPVSLTLRLYINVIVGYYLCYVIYLASSTRPLSILLIIIPVAIEPFIFIIQSFIFAQMIYLYIGD